MVGPPYGKDHIVDELLSVGIELQSTIFVRAFAYPLQEASATEDLVLVSWIAFP